MRKFTDWLRDEAIKREAQALATDQLIQMQAETIAMRGKPYGCLTWPFRASNDAEAITRLFRQSGFLGESPASQEGEL